MVFWLLVLKLRYSCLSKTKGHGALTISLTAKYSCLSKTNGHGALTIILTVKIQLFK